MFPTVKIYEEHYVAPLLKMDFYSKGNARLSVRASWSPFVYEARG
jgi:hypothetical protein